MKNHLSILIMSMIILCTEKPKQENQTAKPLNQNEIENVKTPEIPKNIYDQIEIPSTLSAQDSDLKDEQGKMKPLYIGLGVGGALVVLATGIAVLRKSFNKVENIISVEKPLEKPALDRNIVSNKDVVIGKEPLIKNNLSPNDLSGKQSLKKHAPNIDAATQMTPEQFYALLSKHKEDMRYVNTNGLSIKDLKDFLVKNESEFATLAIQKIISTRDIGLITKIAQEAVSKRKSLYEASFRNAKTLAEKRSLTWAYYKATYLDLLALNFGVKKAEFDLRLNLEGDPMQSLQGQIDTVYNRFKDDFKEYIYKSREFSSVRDNLTLEFVESLPLKNSSYTKLREKYGSVTYGQMAMHSIFMWDEPLGKFGESNDANVIWNYLAYPQNFDQSLNFKKTTPEYDAKRY